MEFQLAGKTARSFCLFCTSISPPLEVLWSRRYGSTHIAGATWLGFSFWLPLESSPSWASLRPSIQRRCAGTALDGAVTPGQPPGPSAGTASPGNIPVASGESQRKGQEGLHQPCPSADRSRRAEPFAWAAERSKAPHPEGGRGRYTRENMPRRDSLCPPRSSSAARRDPWAEKQVAEKFQSSGNAGTSLHTVFQLRQGSARPRGSDCLSFSAAAEVPRPQVQRGDKAWARPCQRQCARMHPHVCAHTKYSNVHLLLQLKALT